MIQCWESFIKVWQSMAKYGKVWQSMTNYDKLWQIMTNYDKVWQSMTSMSLHQHWKKADSGVFTKL